MTKYNLILDIKVVKCTGLKRADGPSGKKADPYVIIEVDDGNPDIPAVVATTNFKEHTLEPIYNTAFSFHVSRDFMRRGTVMVRVCHHDNDGGQLMGENKLPFPKLVDGENKFFIHYGKLLSGQVTMMVQKTALMTMYQNILKTEQKQNLKVKHTSYVDKLTSSPTTRATLGLITPRAEGDLSRLPVYAPKPIVSASPKQRYGSVKKSLSAKGYYDEPPSRGGLMGLLKRGVLLGAVAVGSIFAAAAIPEDNDITINARKARDAIKSKSQAMSKAAMEKLKEGGDALSKTSSTVSKKLSGLGKGTAPTPPPPAPAAPAKASAPAPVKGPFGYGKVMYKVKAGDTLSMLAFEKGTSVEKIMRLNNMSDSNVIQDGMIIRIR
eukprot:CAMPEP_0118921828 /NCGR_PEP_ID=MMETSP1169-20130426/982_1 /TAXON_ID=36882 /ORGANISM="Pyramimonas obovata, Strain CCMP722" /LENGTH=379 /DNA_ID=CAMNT_0006862619 /DNA_START=42 /DNA_END=1181 /DNA_ORIENTATION=+